MQSSKLGCQAWLYAFYLFATNLKSVSSMNLHRELDIGQKAAWHMAHRIRQAWKTGEGNPFLGPVEADEAYMGEKRKNILKAKRAKLEGRGAVWETAVVAVKDQPTKELRARGAEDTKGKMLRGFVLDNAKPGAKVYTDGPLAYKRLPDQEAVRHASFKYVRGPVHTNGVESFWSMLKRAHMGTFHKISPDHLPRYVAESAGRLSMGDKDTPDQMAEIVSRMEGERLRYKDLVG